MRSREKGVRRGCFAGLDTHTHSCIGRRNLYIFIARPPFARLVIYWDRLINMHV